MKTKFIIGLCLGIMTVTTVCAEDVSVEGTKTEEQQDSLQSVEMNEVVVKSALPKTFVKGDAMRTRISGSVLEKAGNVADMLNKVPTLEAERNGGVKVVGRGDAEVYINGRRVHDVQELTRLRADQIQYVDVVQNPGARYAASTKAVVRIQLKKAQGEGLSLQDYASGMYQYSYTVTNNLEANYRTGGLDITASFWAGRYGHGKSLQENILSYFAGPDYYHGFSRHDSKNVWKGWSPQLQFNYMVNENHSFGAYYKYDRHPSSNYKSLLFTDNYENGIYEESSVSDIRRDDRFRKHFFNAYYNGKLGKLGVDLNVDGLFDKTVTPSTTVETTTDLANNAVVRDIDSETNNGNNFWATKLVLSHPIWEGNLSLGGEYTYNHRTDVYSYTASEAVPVKATDTKINESMTAAFMEYGRAFGKVFTQIGLRYEYLSNDYYDFGKRQDESCRRYGDWFPTVMVSAPIGKVQMSLSYRRDIKRPNYDNLTSSTVYINRYTYQSGNPYLKPTYTHSVVLNGSYKWTNVMVNYSRIKDAETLSTMPFPGADDPLISLIRPINSEKDYNQLTVVTSLRPVIGCWHPIWNVVGMFQNYKSPRSNGEIITLNKPFFTTSWQNDVELPHDTRLNVSMQWSSKGDYNNFSMTRSRFLSTVGIQHDMKMKKMGSLTFDLRCNDVFNTNKTSMTVYGFRELTSSNPARRTFMLDITWKFNEARSKYRGSGAGERQKSRM